MAKFTMSNKTPLFLKSNSSSLHSFYPLTGPTYIPTLVSHYLVIQTFNSKQMPHPFPTSIFWSHCFLHLVSLPYLLN